MDNETIVRDIRIQEQLLKQRGVYGKILNPEDIFGDGTTAMTVVPIRIADWTGHGNL